MVRGRFARQHPGLQRLRGQIVGGNLTISGLQSCWLGTLREQVGGSVTIVNNTLADPDAMEVGSNLISGNMTCFGNSAGGTPTVQFGDGGAAPSMVGGWAAGQCGFNVQVLNPAPEALAQETPPTDLHPDNVRP